MQRDMWVGLAWAGGLVIAMVSVFFYGLITYEPATFDVTWSEREHEETANGATLAEGGDRSHDFEVPGQNLTAIRIVLEWTDAVPNDDEFELSVSTTTEGVTTPEPLRGTSGSIEMPLPLVEAPTTNRAEGANAEHALDQLERPHDPWEGDATFTVTVTLVSAPGNAGTQGLGLDPQADGQNDYFLRFVRVMMDATLTPQG